MCKKCVQTMNKLWGVLCTSATFAQQVFLRLTKKFIYTAITRVSTDFSHINKRGIFKWYATYLPTISTTPITTTIYIYNNNTVGGLKEVS